MLAPPTNPRPSHGLGYLSLFGSVGTLVCCALPSVLVLIGLGTTVASALSTMPWLVTLSRHKDWVFGIAGALIALNFLYTYRIARRFRRSQALCPPDDAACAAADRLGRSLLWVSTGIYAAGFLVAYALGPLLLRFG